MLFDGISWLSLLVGMIAGYMFIPMILPKLKRR